MSQFDSFIRRQPPGRLIALGFAIVILLGAGLLLLPISVRPDAHVSFIDALFTSTSAVCVTGLIAIDTADHFTMFGQAVVAGLIQVGGLGVTSVGVGFILAAGGRVSFKSRLLVKEALNVDGFGGMVRLVRGRFADDALLRGRGRCAQLHLVRAGLSAAQSAVDQHFPLDRGVQQLGV